MKAVAVRLQEGRELTHGEIVPVPVPVAAGQFSAIAGGSTDGVSSSSAKMTST